MAKVKDIAMQIRGVSYHPEDLHDNLDEDSIVLLRANNIKDGKLILDDVVYVSKSKVAEQQYLQTGDILICASSGSKELVGKAAFVDSVKNPMTFGAFCKVVRPQPEYSEYLGHYFNSPVYRRKISALSAGANINNIKNEHIDNLDIQLVDEKERREIITILNELNMLISLRKQQLFKLDELVKAQFVEMFGDFEFNPKEFPVYHLCELCDVGSSKRIYQEEQSISGIPFLKVADLNDLIDTGKYSCSTFIPLERYEQLLHKELTPTENDILITSRGTLGKCYIVQSDDEFYFQDGMISWLSNFSPKVSSIYISYLFAQPYIQKQIESLQAGSTVAYLSITMLKKINVILPPKKLQDDFATFVEHVDQQKQTVQQSLDKLELMKKAQMQEYFG